MSYFHEWRTPIDVKTPLGDGESLGFIDYGYNVNSVWLVRMHGTGAVKHFDSADVVIYGNPMSRGGWDVAEGEFLRASRSVAEPDTLTSKAAWKETQNAKLAWWKAQAEIEKLRAVLRDKGRP